MNEPRKHPLDVLREAMESTDDDVYRAIFAGEIEVITATLRLIYASSPETTVSIRANAKSILALAERVLGQ